MSAKIKWNNMKFVHRKIQVNEIDVQKPKLKVDNSEKPMHGIPLPRYGDEMEFIGDQ